MSRGATPLPFGTMMRQLRTAAVLIAGLGLSASALLHAGGQQGGTPLIEAARSQQWSAVSTLLAGPIDVNVTQPDGATALHWAVHHENLETARLLVEAGADVNMANDLGMTALLMASAAGNAQVVELVLAAGANPNTALASGETPLMAAARAGSLQAVRGLIARGADVNAIETTRGQTALMWAVSNRQPGITRHLLERGAGVHARSRTRRRVFNMGGSRSAGSASQGIALEEVAEGGNTPLLFAARSGDLASARLLVAAGADVHDTSADGNTVLGIAVHSGHGSLAAFLLDAGADPNAAPLGYTPLHAAILRGTLRDRRQTNDDPGVGVPLVTKLLDAGADPNARLARGTPVRRWSHDFAFMDRWVGATPFWLASMFLEVDMMHALIDGGADPRIPNRDGTTPLMAAAGLGYSRGGGSAFIKDRRDFSSYNPVASAELGSSIPAGEERLALEAVRTAVELGADIEATNDAGNTALHAAASHGMNTVIEFLTGQGASVSVENERGQTPLELAVYSDGIAGDSFVRESTADLLRTLGDTAPTHPTDPHAHPEAHALTNPVDTTGESVAAGAQSYDRLCAACHGTTGRGDGRLASATAAYGARPPDLTDDTWQHGASDGEVFAVIRDGIGPDFAMDAYSGRLTEPDIWNLVNYLKSLR